MHKLYNSKETSLLGKPVFNSEGVMKSLYIIDNEANTSLEMLKAFQEKLKDEAS